MKKKSINKKAYIDYAKFSTTKLIKKPFEYMVMSGFIKPDITDCVVDDFPKITDDGSFALDSVTSGKHFLNFIEELKSDTFRDAVAKKFSVDLRNKPVMITARGRCKDSNGKIHIDSKGKIITVLVYLNKKWPHAGGKLRLLKNEFDLEDYLAEVTPLAGTIVIFKCTDNAWHGHRPFAGARKAIQLNWVVDDSYLQKERTRHKISAWFKRLRGIFK